MGRGLLFFQPLYGPADRPTPVASFLWLPPICLPTWRINGPKASPAPTAPTASTASTAPTASPAPTAPTASTASAPQRPSTSAEPISVGHGAPIRLGRTSSMNESAHDTPMTMHTCAHMRMHVRMHVCQHRPHIRTSNRSRVCTIQAWEELEREGEYARLADEKVHTRPFAMYTHTPNQNTHIRVLVCVHTRHTTCVMRRLEHVQLADACKAEAELPGQLEGEWSMPRSVLCVCTHVCTHACTHFCAHV